MSRGGFPCRASAWPETCRRRSSCSRHSKVHEERRFGTDSGLGHYVSTLEDPDAVVARAIQSPVFRRECLRLLIDLLLLRVTERPIRGLRRKLSQPKEDVLQREVAPSATFKKLIPSLTLRAA